MECGSAFDAALDVLRDAGATLVDIELPHARYAIPVYYLICTAEASSNLARYDGVKYGHRSPAAKDESLTTMYSRTRDEGFGAEVKRRIMLGTYVLSAGYYDAFYLKAQQVRTLLRRDYEHAFTQADVIVMPTSPIPPFKLGEKTDDPLQMYLADIFTVSVNLAGLPGISIPCGFTSRSRASADRVSGDRPDVRRGDDAARRRCVRACDGLGEGSGASVNCRLFAPFLHADFCILNYDRPRYDTDRPTGFAHAARCAGRRLQPGRASGLGSAAGAADTTSGSPASSPSR